MKLDRFSKIRRHRIFRDFAWGEALPNFSQFNLIYGWNGTGKTTLSGIFKSLQSAQNIDSGEVDFVFDGTTTAGCVIASAALPHVRVFNRDTVARSVFESASRDLGYLPPVYVFGEESAEKQRALDELRAQLPDLIENIRSASEQESAEEKNVGKYATDTARAIKNLLIAPGSPFNTYDASSFKDKVARFDPSDKTLQDDKVASLVALKDAQPLNPVHVNPITFPDLLSLHAEIRDVLKKTVVSNVIQGLTDSPKVSGWIRAGLALHTEHGDSNTCYFCNQDLPAERLRSLEAHFNDEFQSFVEQVNRLSQKLEETASRFEGHVFPGAADFYPELRSEYEKARRTLETHLSNVRNGLKALANAVKAKQDRVFESLSLEDLIAGGDGEAKSNQSILHLLLQAMSSGLPAISEFMGKQAEAKIHELVGAHNKKTALFSDEVKAARNMLHDHELSIAFPEWSQKLEMLEVAKARTLNSKQAKTAVDTQIDALEKDLLEHRAPADELNRELISYLGHSDIQFYVHDTGYRLVRHGVAAENLSEGERTAIAFLYFLKSLQDRSFDKEHSIVVVDDPISSLDSNSLYCAFGFMKRALANVEQLFVLTHNYMFLRQVRNWFKFLNRGGKKRAGFYMLKVALSDGHRASSIQEMDPFLKDYESEYHYLFKCIVDGSKLAEDGPLGTYYELPNIARRLLESFLVFKVPNEGTLHARLEAVAYDGPKKTRDVPPSSVAR